MRDKALFNVEVENKRISLVIDDGAPNPEEEYDRYSKDELKAWENGEVFGYIVEEKCETCGEFHHVDSCFGFYGFDAAKELIPGHLDENLRSAFTERIGQIG